MCCFSAYTQVFHAYANRCIVSIYNFYVTKLIIIMQLILDIPDKFQQLGLDKSSLSQQVRLFSALLLFQSGQLSRGGSL